MPEKLFDNFIRSKLNNYTAPVPDGLWDKIAHDNFIRTQLNNYSAPVPDGLWEKIVRDKDERPTVFWWTNRFRLLAAILIIILMAGGFYFVINQKQNIANNNSTFQNNTTQAEQNKLSLQHNSKAESKVDVNDKSAFTNTESNTAAPSVNTISRKKDQSNISSGFYYSKNNKAMLSFLQSKNSKSSSDIPELNNNDNESALSSENEMQHLYSQKKLNGEVLSSSGNIYSLNNLHNPPLNLRTIFGLGNDCPSANGPQRNDWYLELYGSPDYTMKSLSGNGLSNAYIQKKDSAEKMYGGFTVGARISKNVGDHFMLKAGVQYSQLNEKFALQTESERRTTVVIVSRTVIRPQGDTTFNDTTSVTQIGYAVRKSINSYKNIEIPIGVGYEFGDVKDKWKLAVNGGIILNITSWYNGVTLDTSYNVISVNSKGNSGFYTRNAGLSVYGSVSVIRNINDKLDVFAEPYFRLGLTGISSNIGYSQKFNAAGISLGVRMKLNKKQHL